MARYLTPAKISLLVLIELYVDDAVPEDAILPTLSFIASHIIDSNSLVQQFSSSSPTTLPTDRWSRAESAISILLSLADFERALSPFAAASGLPGRRLWDVFLGRLWAIDSLHALHEFLDRRPALLAKTREELRAEEEAAGSSPTAAAAAAAAAAADDGAGATANDDVTIPASPDSPTEAGPAAAAAADRIRMTPTSPFGAFVRRALVEFRRLRFQDACALWREFVRYRQPTAEYWRHKNPKKLLGPLGFDSVLVEGQEQWGLDGAPVIASVAYGSGFLADGEGAKENIPVSFEDVEALLEFQIEQMQTYGVRVPADLRGRFEELLRNSYSVPSLSHYLRYLEAWKSGDYPTSFDFLHRYFDYTMQSRDQLFYQYALMNFAVLQNEFGCHKEALAAMLETVSTARENRDVSCLNFALSWLYHFGKAHPDLVADLESNSMLGSGKESLAFLRVKAREANNWTLWCSALISEAKLTLTSGESVASAMELMVRGSHVLVEHNMKGMLGAQLGVQISLWERLGVSALAHATCDIFLRCYAPYAMLDDELKLVCRMAGQLAMQGRYDDSLALLETHEDGLGRSNGSSINSTNNSRGSIGSSGSDDDENKPAPTTGAPIPWRPVQYWAVYRGIVKLRRALHRADLDGAHYLLTQLLQTRPDDLDHDLAFVVDTLHAEYLLRRHDLPAAFALVERRLRDDDGDDDDQAVRASAVPHGRDDVAMRVRLLLLKAHLFDRAGRPQRGFTAALRAAALARDARLVPALWTAVGAVANVLNALGEFAGAAALLGAVVPRYLECGSVFGAGQLCAWLADAHVGLAGLAGKGGGGGGGGVAVTSPRKGASPSESNGKGSRRTDCLVRAHAMLDQALGHFAAVEDVERQCEMLAKKAALLKAAGDVARANEYAGKYLALRQQTEGPAV